MRSIVKHGVVAFFTLLLAEVAMANFYDFKATGLDGKPANLEQYKGKVALVANTASQCGYTPQYKSLQAVYEKYKAKGFVVMGFPSNDFGGQEPGTNQEIKKFCELNYGVNFPLFSKAPVKGASKQEIFKFLTEQAPDKGEVEWNFEKFLIDQKGQVVARFRSKVKPDSPEVLKKIDELLASQ